MWKYNNTNDLYPEYDSLYHSADELYHYGVLGMRWGHRKSQAVINANKEYKRAKEAEKTERRKATFRLSTYKPSTFLAGRENEQKAKARFADLRKATQKREKAAFKLIDAAAKDSYNKSYKKYGSKKLAEKAAMKTHYRAFKQDKYGKGLSGSVADAETKGNTRYYNHLAKTKGKKYANAVEKKYQNNLLGKLGGSVAVIVGSEIAYQYYKNK